MLLSNQRPSRLYPLNFPEGTLREYVKAAKVDVGLACCTGAAASKDTILTKLTCQTSIEKFNKRSYSVEKLCEFHSFWTDVTVQSCQKLY